MSHRTFLLFFLVFLPGIRQNSATSPLLDRECEVDSVADFRGKRNAVSSDLLLWPDGVVYYDIAPELDFLQDRIEGVMREYEKETCIRFKPRNDVEHYVKIHLGKGCSSNVGRFPFGFQLLSLGLGCHNVGTITHELGHALGFHHEHNRSDRDDYLEIIWDNVMPGYEGQFKKLLPTQNVLLNEFDYKSIMLYGSTTFSKDHISVTMNPKKEGIGHLKRVAEKEGLSESDIERINTLYKCQNRI